MTRARLQLALERLAPSDWERFERLASSYLATEFGELITTATPSGDGGRDAVLFSPHADPRVLMQYSIADDWAQKIRDTARRIQETFPDTLALVYVSNHQIGARGDVLRREIRKEFGLTLDVRDQGWFLDRVDSNLACQRAAEELARVVVDPILASAGVTSRPPSELSSPEAIAALTFLGLQWRDDQRERGLTKLALEALVRAVLANTHSSRRLHRNDVRAGVARLLPTHPREQVDARVDSALMRLTKRAIRHWPKDDEFCLTHDEHLRVDAFKAEALLAESQLVRAIQEISRGLLAARIEWAGYVDAFTVALRAATDAVLFERSQAFAMAVQTGQLGSLADSEFGGVILSELTRAGLPKAAGLDWGTMLHRGVCEILRSDVAAIQIHMRALADAYTLLAFLKLTPDVQKAVEKMFSHGQIWLDTSVVLPLFAESLMGDGSGRFTRVYEAAREAGLELYVTEGVLEEIERHMNLGLMCARMDRGGWQGAVPYLLEEFVSSGRSPSAFAHWLENFRGDFRPVQDIGEYLKEQFGVQTRSLDEERRAAPPELRDSLQLLWYEAHRRRRGQGKGPIDDGAIARLVDHDVEAYCGVVQLRSRETASPFGYTAWWLTLDRRAFDLKPRLRDYMKSEPPDSPVLSADFLVNYLAFGPTRQSVGKAKEAHLPLMMELEAARYLTPELISEAEVLREEMKELPQRVVRRRIRDHLDRARRRIGPIAKAGLFELDDELAIDVPGAQ